ncbi:hypothetical protein [Ferrimonas marina]|uniref:Uncharacterized protein n=1 Tax=Ferrimonas marina TaxID=299255 RepID=A0A1M5REQ6_9GAMM|nr:hypothetical protein [Ferrimonas marina]SHH24842.1 hypothetical protein SAMN02745129_1597 [Ferrimonas marina]
MSPAPWSRPIALALLLWSIFLSMLAAPALAEEFHDHDHGVPCAQALLIEHWYQATGLTPFILPTSPSQAVRSEAPSYGAPSLALSIRGGRGPPA